MTILLLIPGVLLACVLVIAKSLMTDEVRGRIQRWVIADVEATIASLPEGLWEEWAEEWRAELAAVISMPMTAVLFARGLRSTTAQLVGEPVPAPAGANSLGRTGGRLRLRSNRFAELLQKGRRQWASIREKDGGARARMMFVSVVFLSFFGVAGFVSQRLSVINVSETVLTWLVHSSFGLAILGLVVDAVFFVFVSSPTRR